jgi:hypothetical protein
VPLASLGVVRGGLFWFFERGNPEMLVKVLDGCGLNDHFWIFAVAGTDAGFEIRSTDRATGAVATYPPRRCDPTSDSRCPRPAPHPPATRRIEPADLAYGRSGCRLSRVPHLRRRCGDDVPLTGSQWRR